MRIIIAGGRSFNDYRILRNALDEFLSNLPKLDFEIVSGGANGADKLGERYAKERNLRVKRFIPNWRRPDGSTDRGAGIKRNHEMGDYADVLIAFWDGRSNGTRDMINYATKKGLWVEVVRYDKIL